MADNDVLSLSNSGCGDNLNSDLDSLFNNNTQKVNTRADTHNGEKPKTKRSVIKGSELCSKRKLTPSKGHKRKLQPAKGPIQKKKTTKRSSKSNV